MCHGIGRSGDISESQPKAAGSSLMNQLTNSMLLDFIHIAGVKNAKKCILLPMATGMSIMLCLLHMKSLRPSAKYVLWSRIDQKSCIKCILLANLTPVVIEPVQSGDQLETNLEEFQVQLDKLGTENIACIISTTSCFAPRGCDDIVKLAEMSRTHGIPHIVNNAYGLTSTYLTHQIETASRCGNIDVFVQSTDKNLLVPVGGAIVAAFNTKIIDDIAKSYAGRGSSSQTLDVFMTLLSLGHNGIKNLLKDRKTNFEYLQTKLTALADSQDERVMISKRNPISIAMTLANFTNPEVIGSMLFTRGVSGCRVISLQEMKTIGTIDFKSWGSHKTENNGIPYMTAAASMGITRTEVDNFIIKLEKILVKIKSDRN